MKEGRRGRPGVKGDLWPQKNQKEPAVPKPGDSSKPRTQQAQRGGSCHIHTGKKQLQPSFPHLSPGSCQAPAHTLPGPVPKGRHSPAFPRGAPSQCLRQRRGDQVPAPEHPSAGAAAGPQQPTQVPGPGRARRADSRGRGDCGSRSLGRRPHRRAGSRARPHRGPDRRTRAARPPGALPGGRGKAHAAPTGLDGRRAHLASRRSAGDREGGRLAALAAPAQARPAAPPLSPAAAAAAAAAVGVRGAGALRPFRSGSLRRRRGARPERPSRQPISAQGPGLARPIAPGGGPLGAGAEHRLGRWGSAASGAGRGPRSRWSGARPGAEPAGPHRGAESGPRGCSEQN
ncbi:translation initiation factor IF-2-like [Pipistrellus kuhlii]|uniref:translation initiation factor IF-2-like n=1 Tax=Pipistrellus kuhlii TaxID=59472 RepID=UPI001E272828|nr:translation initiation factor IF-2-like [Pipistrellus kuhlii]